MLQATEKKKQTPEKTHRETWREVLLECLGKAARSSKVVSDQSQRLGGNTNKPEMFWYKEKC